MLTHVASAPFFHLRRPWQLKRHVISHTSCSLCHSQKTGTTATRCLPVYWCRQRTASPIQSWAYCHVTTPVLSPQTMWTCHPVLMQSSGTKDTVTQNRFSNQFADSFIYYTKAAHTVYTNIHIKQPRKW